MNEDSDLTVLMSSYLNIDFKYTDPDPWEVVRVFARTEGVDIVANAVVEAQGLLSRHLGDDDLDKVLSREHGLGYVPRLGGYSTNDWLTQVADLLDRMVRQRRAGN
ncbi:MAG: contact-dependent growth inhibition system immunity protein [Lapillicoccus sp.]